MYDVWAAAQVAEALFHANVAYRSREHLQRAFYSGMLEIDSVHPNASIIDFGCGPESLLLKQPPSDFGRRVAVDPLTFSDEDEARYAKHGIKRIHSPIEKLILADYFDEVWVYNCLQHVINPSTVLSLATRYGHTVRIFEWVNEPRSVVHIHSPSEEFIRDTLAHHGLHPLRETSGRSSLTGHWSQEFYAGVWAK